jgi:hypothetical protein
MILGLYRRSARGYAGALPHRFSTSAPDDIAVVFGFDRNKVRRVYVGGGSAPELKTSPMRFSSPSVRRRAVTLRPSAEESFRSDAACRHVPCQDRCGATLLS